MEKFKNALKSVNKLGLLALVLVAFSTLAFKASNEKLAMKKWANVSGTWVDVNLLQQSNGEETNDYRCTGAQNTCTAEFPDTITDPNSDPLAVPSNIINGNFSYED